jgi:galactonate dehydratase
MKITQIETIRLKAHTRLLWVIVKTDGGISGWGETYDKVGPVKTAIHEICSHFLLGRDPRDIEKIWQDMFTYIHFHGYAAAEMRAVSAIDIALWDILGKITGLPIYRLLGGAVRDRVPLYATCDSRNIQILNGDEDPGRTVEAVRGFMRLGYSGVKFDPYLGYSDRNLGQFISRRELEKGTDHIRHLRAEFGNDLEIALDSHCAWNTPCASQIVHEIEPYGIMFYEEPIQSDNVEEIARLAASTSIPICESERLFTRWMFRPFLEKGAARVAMPDVAWTGGITEMKKIATMAAAYNVPIAPHNCGGPGTFYASLHLCLNLPNMMVCEAVPENYARFYEEIVQQNIPISEGHALPVDRPGLGTELRTDLLQRSDVEHEVTNRPNEWGKSPVHKLVRGDTSSRPPSTP